MSQFRCSRAFYIVVFLAAVVMISLACGTSTTEQLQEAAQPTATESQAKEEPTLTTVGAAEPAEAEPVEELPEAAAEPTLPPAAPTPEPEPIVLVNQGFGQDEREVGFAFVVENPNGGLAFEDSRYQLAVLDEAGVIVETDSGYIALLLPGQSLGVGGTMYVGEGVTVSSIEVQLNAGDAVATEPIPAFSVESVAYYPSEYFSKATGVLTNPYDRDISDLRVSAVALDGAGRIVGGGFTFLNFVLANSSTGVEVSLTSAGEIAEVELHPVISGLSMLSRDHELPSGATSIVLVKYGYGQDDQQAGFGFLVQNPNDGFSVENSQYHLTAYAADGTVLETDEGYLNVVLPGETLGMGGDIYLDEGAMIDHVTVQLIPGEYVQSEPIPPFASENISYQPDDYFPTVTGFITSPYSTDITDIRVSAIAYNEAGDIIGGGFTYLDFVPANSKAAAEVSVTTAGIPATVELYGTVSALSDFE